MTWVKICGITNLEDARIAVDAGADALGFVFWEKSPRKVEPKVARDIVDHLPESLEKAGVFGKALDESAIDIFNEAHLTAVQTILAFDCAPKEQKAYGLDCFWCRPRFYTALSASWILAEQGRLDGMIESFNRWGDSIPPEARESMPAGLFDTFLLDAGGADQPGGTGRTFEWNKALPLVEAMRSKVKVVVAGGLNPGNVADAIRILHPWGVDVVSGVEARPGKKDAEKVRAFVKAVRDADKSA
jgi:phosphoribosylanthranilate isomerase